MFDMCTKAHEAYYKNIILWMKTIHYPNKIDLTWSQSYQLMVLFTPKSNSKLRSTLHFRDSIVITRFISS